MRLDTLVTMRRGRSRATACGLDPVVARNAPRAPSQDDGRASQTISGRRPLGTTSRPSVGSSDHRRQEPAALTWPSRRAGDNPRSRQPTRSSRRARRGASCWFRTTVAPR
jgi:hypothetical protein